MNELIMVLPDKLTVATDDDVAFRIKNDVYLHFPCSPKNKNICPICLYEKYRNDDLFPICSCVICNKCFLRQNDFYDISGIEYMCHCKILEEHGFNICKKCDNFIILPVKKSIDVKYYYLHIRKLKLCKCLKK